jgi:ACS family pantothenate transporter-like MFS transporter
MVGVMATWLPLIVWQQVEAPRYRKGFITASCMGAVGLVLIVIIKLLQDKETIK